MNVVWISGTSSGIGQACLAQLPADFDEVVTIARRPAVRGRQLLLDLSDPGSWETAAADFSTVLGRGDITGATFLHLAGTVAPLGAAVHADRAEYTSAFLLNAGSTIVLGQAFAAACVRHQVPATLVVASSPAASDVVEGLSHYGAAKAAVEHWLRIVAAEVAQANIPLRVLAVVPQAVDTPMVRGVMEADPSQVALSGHFAELARANKMATPRTAAQHIWAAIADPNSLSVVPVGATGA